MPHLVLIGDSIFDNAAYTRGGPDVVSQLRELLPSGWEATRLAVDGSTTDHVAGQLGRLPSDATHLVVSVGGNNALSHLSVLETPVSSTAQAVDALATIGSDFEARYRLAISACVRTGVPLAVCTIYNGCFEDRSFQRIAATMLTIFNDAIVRVAIEHALPVIDLRAVCASPEDYANPIEPSSVGGGKIAQVIVGLVSGTGIAPGTRIIDR
jgi:lysophospholipase L1-like esterase